MVLYADLETYSPVDLKKSGAYRYAEEAEILLWAYAIDDGPVSVWDVTVGSMPDDLRAAIDSLSDKKNEVCSHNSAFDRTILRAVMPQFSWNDYTWRDTMVRAYRHALRGALADLCETFAIPADKAKDKDGRQLVFLFCKPQSASRKYARATRKTHPVEWERFKDYAASDIEAMRAIDAKIPTWNDTETEKKLWWVDQSINDDGFRVDMDLAQKATSVIEEERQDRNARIWAQTNGVVAAATQRDAMLKLILDEYGVSLPDLQLSTLKRRVEDPDLPRPVKDLLVLRMESSGTAVSKYKAIINAVCSDGRLRGTLQCYGATRTGRWSGRIFQPQNLPRPQFKREYIEAAIVGIKNRTADLLTDNVTQIASSAIRGVVIPDPDHKFCIADLAGIEGRVLAWVAGEEWKLQAYRDFDKGIGYDMYVRAYAKAFNVDPETVDKPKRQIGKTLELAMGYAGGVGAFLTFARVFDIDVDALADQAWPSLDKALIAEAQAFYDYSKENGNTHGLSPRTFVACDTIKRMWRASNPAIVRFWKGVSDALTAAAVNGTSNRVSRCTVDRKGSYGRILLPSGRYVLYPGLRYTDHLSYLGVNQYSRKWGRIATYSGKITENIVQAVSRDVFAYGLVAAFTAGYKPVLHVHDEIVAEVPDRPAYAADSLVGIMSCNPLWADGLPLAAAGFESYRYGKED